MADASIYRLYLPHEAGKDGYPLAWHETIKHLVREEAGHRCVRCKHPYFNGHHGRGEWSPCDQQCTHRGPLMMDGRLIDNPVMSAGEMLAPDSEVEACIVLAQWRILTVHHLDEVKLNCRWWNLAALCQRCHLTIQGRVKMHRPYFLEHSEWMKPYVAGFYALVHLKEELSREEVMGRIDELLALASREVAHA